MLFPYRPLTGTKLPEHQWKQDFEAAERIQNVRFGKECVYLGRFGGFGGRYIPYSDIVRWFVNVEAASGGEATFHIYRFVVNYGEEGEYAASLGEVSADLNEKTPLEQVNALVARHSEIPYGRDYSRKSRFAVPEK